MTQPSKVFAIQPTLDVPALARIRYPSWLKSLYNVAQMELTTLDPLGAFYLVARDVDWNARPENQATNGSIRARPNFTTPHTYANNASSAVISNYNLALNRFEAQQRSRSDLHAAIMSSIGLPVQHSINSKHAFGSGSLSPLQLVLELDAMFGTLTKDEITTTQSIIASPLVHFGDFREFCSTVTQNYEFLTAANHIVPELTRIDIFTTSIQPWPQFDTYITAWQQSTALANRTLISLTDYLLANYGDMPKDHQSRGGNAFWVSKGKGKKSKGSGRGKGKYSYDNKGTDSSKGKGRGYGTKRTRDVRDNNSTVSSVQPSQSASQISVDSSASATESATPQLQAFNVRPHAWSRGEAPNPVTSLTMPSNHDVNPATPYLYCWYHGWNFTHRSHVCKKIKGPSSWQQLQATSPTSVRI